MQFLPLRVLVLADAQPGVGLGHLFRTAVLADALRRLDGAEVIYGIAPHPLAEAAVRRLGYAAATCDDTRPPAEYLRRVRELVGDVRPAAVVVDSYRLPPETYRGLAALPETAVLIIDDDNRLPEYDADLLLNYSPTAEGLPYRTTPRTRTLFGLRYLPLRETIRTAAAARARRPPAGRSRLLVTMGGADPQRATLTIGRALRELALPLTVTVVIGPQFTAAEEVRRLAADWPDCTVLDQCPDLAPLFAETDLAVSACGITGWELACCRIPFVGVILSADQRPSGEYLRRRECLLGALDFTAGEPADPAGVLRRALSDADRRTAVAARLPELIPADAGAESGARLLIDAARLALLRRSHPRRAVTVATVRGEYETSAAAADPWRKVRWGSPEGMRHRLVRVAELLRPSAPRVVVDLGCGTGDFFSLLRQGDPAVRGIGIDLVRPLLAAAPRGRGLGWVQARGDALPLRSGTADAVTLIGIAQNCGIPLPVLLAEAGRLLRRGGRLVLVTKHLGWEKFLNGELEPEPDHDWFTAAEIEAALGAGGCRILARAGFLPRSGETVRPRESHELVYLAEKAA